MKCLWLVPHTMNVQTIVRSYYHAKYPGETYFFGKQSFEDVKNYKPDFLFYIGAVEGECSLSIDQLKTLRDQGTKLVMIHMECGNPGWNDLILEYHKQDIFYLIVGVGGIDNWPKRQRDTSLCGFVDPTYYKQYSNTEKDILCGVSCGFHPERQNVIQELGKLVTKFDKRTEEYGNYEEYVKWLCRCRFFLNLNFIDFNNVSRGGNFKEQEAGLASAVFLEKKGSSVSHWFTPGWDYLEYETIDDIKRLLKTPEKELEIIRQNMIVKIRLFYPHEKSWNKIFDRIFALETRTP